MIITQAPDVHLIRWLVHSAAFFKTKRSKTLLMFKSIKIKVFCDLEDIHKIQTNVIFLNRGRPQGNISKKGIRHFSKSRPPAGQHSQKGKSRFFIIEAARRATSPEREIVIFQNRGRPQGNIPKKGSRDFSESKRPQGSRGVCGRHAPQLVESFFALLVQKDIPCDDARLPILLL